MLVKIQESWQTCHNCIDRECLEKKVQIRRSASFLISFGDLESGIELCNDFLIPVTLEHHNMPQAMVLPSIKSLVEMRIIHLVATFPINILLSNHLLISSLHILIELHVQRSVKARIIDEDFLLTK